MLTSVIAVFSTKVYLLLLHTVPSRNRINRISLLKIMAEELDNLTTLTKTDPSGRKMGARELEELITREAFKNKIQKSEKINLKVKTVDELQDLLDKQVGIKKNKLIINLLPDKVQYVLVIIYNNLFSVLYFFDCFKSTNCILEGSNNFGFF